MPNHYLSPKNIFFLLVPCFPTRNKTIYLQKIPYIDQPPSSQQQQQPKSESQSPLSQLQLQLKSQLQVKFSPSQGLLFDRLITAMTFFLHISHQP